MCKLLFTVTALLALPLFQLQQTIDTAVSTNPVIEYEYRPEVSEINDMSVNTDNPHNTFDEEDHFQDYDGGMNDNSGIQEKRDYLFNSYAEERSMQDIFADELKYRDFSPREQELANALTAAIDEKGYLATPLADIAQSTGTQKGVHHCMIQHICIGVSKKPC